MQVKGRDGCIGEEVKPAWESTKNNKVPSVPATPRGRAAIVEEPVTFKLVAEAPQMFAEI